MNEIFDITCAWCGGVAEQGEVASSHGICHDCMFDVLNLPKLNLSELNRLPYGVIKIDSKGIIKLYNSAEAELSQKRASEVIGLNFFTEVAPCTRVKDFYGRFVEFLSIEDISRVFIFTFPFVDGAVEVQIVFVRVDIDNFLITIKQMSREQLKAKR